MLKGIFANDRFWIKSLIFTFLTIFGLITWINITRIFHLDQTNIISLQLGQLAFSIVGLAFPALASAYLFKKDEINYLHTDIFPTRRFILLAVLVMLLISPFINLITSWNEQISFPESLSKIEALFRKMQTMTDDLTVRMLDRKSIYSLFANLFFLALVPSITEELFFRGVLQRLLGEKIGAHLGIWIVAIIFSAYHMQFFGFFPRILLGALLGYLLLWSNSLYLPIIGHFTNNATLIFFYFLSSRKVISFNIDDIGIGNQWWLGLLSLIFVIPFFFYMNKKYLRFKEKIC